jgi:exodeoxyribonuclease VII large subunit
VRILLARAPVQGPDAPVRMGRALAALCRVPEVDAIILGRGGGSADDLAAFNDEALVRQIAACRVPVISAVGHEIDVTLADLAADARAATPSQAAELVVPDAAARAQEVAHLRARLARAFRHRVASERAALQRTSARFASPARLLGERRQGLDEAREAMVRALRRAVAEGRGDVARLERRLLARHPSAVVAGARAALRPLRGRLDASERRHAGLLRARLSDLAARLDALSPLAVLGRGYSITAAPSGALVVDARDLSPGDLVHVRVHRGGFHASVLDTELASDASGAPGGSNTTGAPARPAKDGR